MLESQKKRVSRKALLEKARQVTFTPVVKSENGASESFTIENLEFPNKYDFRPMSKIWSSVRKRVLELYGVDAVGVFAYDGEKKAIKCSFYLNYSVVDGKSKEGIEAYRVDYQNDLDSVTGLLKYVIKTFVATPANGYFDYLKVLEEDASLEDPEEHQLMREIANEILEAFLIQIGIKQPQDEKRKKPPKK